MIIGLLGAVGVFLPWALTIAAIAEESSRRPEGQVKIVFVPPGGLRGALAGDPGECSFALTTRNLRVKEEDLQ